MMETTQKGADTNFILHASHHLKSTQSTISIYLSPDDAETMVLATVLGINRRNNHKQNQEGICRNYLKALAILFQSVTSMSHLPHSTPGLSSS